LIGTRRLPPNAVRRRGVRGDLADMKPIILENLKSALASNAVMLAMGAPPDDRFFVALR
jgi:hypothetical protein